jgi:hypothetical protein
LVTGIHNKVFACLLDLNQQRYEMESLAGKKATPKKLKREKVEKQLNIIPPDTEQLDFF